MSRDDTAREEGPTEYQSNPAMFLADIKRLRAENKSLRAPRSDDRGGWTLDYDYLNLIAETMDQEFRVGMEEIEAVLLAHEAQALVRQPIESKREHP